LQLSPCPQRAAHQAGARRLDRLGLLHIVGVCPHRLIPWRPSYLPHPLTIRHAAVAVMVRAQAHRLVQLSAAVVGLLVP